MSAKGRFVLRGGEEMFVGCWFRVALACIQGGALNLRLKLFPEWSVGAYAVLGVMSGELVRKKKILLFIIIYPRSDRVFCLWKTK